MKAKRTMLWICIFAGLVVGFSALLAVGCSASLYHPTRQIEATPTDSGLAYEDLYLTAADGKKINCWYVPCENAIGTVLAFHGNAGNISHRVSTLAMFHSLGVNILMVDYHGYGRSEGSPGKRATAMDADAG